MQIADRIFVFGKKSVITYDEILLNRFLSINPIKTEKKK